MNSFLKSLILGSWALATASHAGDVLRDIILEVDPVAPASAAYEQDKSGIATSKWGASVDFNLGTRISTGPEYWSGNFVAKGPDSGSTSGYRREDFWPGERHKLDATRFRWHVGVWQQAQAMRGWYVKGAYSYTKINSRANRFTESVDGSTGLVVANDNPMDETDLITDTRHGLSIGCGSRWFIYERLTASIGASITKNLRRTVDVDSSDNQAESDYDDLINSKIPDTRMSTRPTPEVNMGMGYAF